MKTLLLIILFSGIGYTVSGQTPIAIYDSLLSRFLTRYIEYPDYKKDSKSGINLLHISNRNDAVILKTEYCSDNKFRIKNMDSLTSKLKTMYALLLPENFDLIFQIIFSFDSRKDISNDLQSRVSKEITRLKSKKYHFSKSPLWLVINEPMK